MTMLTVDQLEDALMAHTQAGWADLGRALLRAGLAERAVLACFGVAAIAHVPLGRRWDTTPPRAAVAPWLLCGGGAVDRELARKALGGAFDALDHAGLLAFDAGRVRARVAIAPAGGHGALAVSDPPLASGDRDQVCGPDDSSHHLVSALPPHRVGRWLDLATGAAWAPLAAAGRAAVVVATDVNPRAIEMARLGAALSGIELDLAVADLFDPPPPGRFDLVTCNAPMPSGTGPRHRVSPAGERLIARLWEIAPGVVDPAGELVVHVACGVAPPAMPGELVIARYTPDGVPPFAIVAWRPGRPDRRHVVEISLSHVAPHVPRSAVELR
jgi:SAM-dependent methyltransferase